MTQRENDIATLRAFNRVYTLRLGLLQAKLDKSPFTLSEARVLYELAHRTDPTAAEIGRALLLDRAQLSRTLKRFMAAGLLTSRGDPAHGRHRLLALTPEGRATFQALEAATCVTTGNLLASLPLPRRNRLLTAAKEIVVLFQAEAAPHIALRALQPGDLGMIIARQAILYACEYGYSGDYEALIASILANFHQNFDPARDDAWIAHCDDTMAGSIFLVRGDRPGVGKLRLLYVEPDMRGMGAGSLLVDTCVSRARALGYGRLELWTDSQLLSARRLYARSGFAQVEARQEHYFGQEIGSEIWALDL
ncbi:bifunctional helix-turn-helix transcriptional regulator/GNAT family N-acetyltransferase [Novosphingobium sediminicola]|uniref:DNA-binding MarR family transcriptional regulator n=1 Tax=Novosphingobium sediminicola TaxID=563162 RepID=A0A7W6CLE7_9SPHN|nr:helix-turn-helix domain-containing GNAT family N-acetyltransferase [Novosphingobium sediminicola]MBB3953617.1 DNA-binding MarR family transcriptional regulator [Novosphingobium sediminicola]